MWDPQRLYIYIYTYIYVYVSVEDPTVHKTTLFYIYILEVLKMT